MEIVGGRFDGSADLPTIAKALGFGSVVELVLDRAVFAPPTIVRETSCRPIVNSIRAGVVPGYGKVSRDQFIEPAAVERLWGMRCRDADAPGVLADDNMSAHHAFACCFTVKRDKASIRTTNLAHIHGAFYSKHPRYFTSLANLVLVPWWLSKLTDGDRLVCQALRYVARASYGFCPGCAGTGKSCAVCAKPETPSLDEPGAVRLAERSEAHRVKDYVAALRAVSEARWRLATNSVRGYDEPFMRIV